MVTHAEEHSTHLSAVPPIGSLLVAEEYIISQDLDFALEHQKHSKRPIGEILVRIGAVEPQELERVLTIQKKMTVR
jgi:predicted nuclease of predicted toxin-antitoxin system